jgi:hypothetical protein
LRLKPGSGELEVWLESAEFEQPSQGAPGLEASPSVLDQSDSGFNSADGCPTTRLFPGVVPSNAAALSPNSIPLCGAMQTWVVGVNWWMTEYVRLMFQYSESHLSDYPFFIPANLDLPPGKNNGFDGANIKGFEMRMHVDW